MASQAQLEEQIAALEAEIASAQANLAALREAGDDPAGEAELESYINDLENQLFDAQSQLQEIGTVPDGSDPYSTFGVTGADRIENPYPSDVSAIQGPAYDDNGNLMPGWSLDENNNPVWVGNNPDGTLFVEPATVASANASFAAFKGISTPLLNTRSQATQQDQANAMAQGDWRVRLQLAPGANYLYKSQNPGILKPLVSTNGVLFPYTPSISVSYAASYDGQELTHSNYKVYQYKSSAVDNITITCDFTAQDTFEANYLLAVVHFFRSVTKMFYGQDQNPKRGVPPPLCFLTGLGTFQFDKHALAITSFNYSLPNDVDYIAAGSSGTIAGVNLERTGQSILSRLGSSILPGGLPTGPQFRNTPSGTTEATYVPTKIQLSIGAVPIVSRNDVSNNFSLRDYATGQLLRGSSNKGGAGIW